MRYSKAYESIYGTVCLDFDLMTLTSYSYNKAGQLISYVNDYYKYEYNHMGFLIKRISENDSAEYEYKTISDTGFMEVSSSAYFADAVKRAVDNAITKGTSDTTFSSEDTCTRGQAVTFLWRSEGQPDAITPVSFKDVAQNAYYYAPVQWAVENGVTNGTSDSTFSPASSCTRGQIVTPCIEH